MTGAAIPGTDVTIGKAAPDDPRIDEFYFGDEPWETEIAAEFKSRIWEPTRDLFLFCLGETVIGGARLGFRNLQHPARDSVGPRARYYLILSLGIDVAFQGKANSNDPSRTFAAVILDEIERLGHSRSDCVGISLHVRVVNEKARHVYEKRGFHYEGDSFIEDDQPTLEMRLPF